MTQYIPLHAHSTQGSVGDSILKLKDYVQKAKEYGTPALAITDHGNLTSMYAFNNIARSEGIKPIFGCEVYETADRLDKDKTSEGAKMRYHLVLLAKNEVGMSNLLSIVNDAHLNGFYTMPRTDLEFMKKHGEGIICLSACISGKIPKAILRGDEDSVIIEYIKEYKEIFDEFYLEIHPASFDKQLLVNKELVRFSQLTDTPLVVTNDVHYLKEEDALAHDAHVKIKRKKKFDDDMVYADSIYWFMDYQRVKSLFADTIDERIIEEAIANTAKIASSCNVELNKELYLPKFDSGTKDSSSIILADKCFRKLDSIKHMIEDPASYMSRLLYELDTIEQLGFSDYFLMVEDFINYAKSEGIPVGPGRGSVGGALVAYLLGISLADPIKYNLIFERFLSVHRTGFPDVDLDFDSTGRDRIFSYAVSKYGADHCSLVSTLNMRKSKSAIRDTARILGLDLEIANKAASLIPISYYDEDGEKMTDLSIEESLEISEDLRKMSEEYPELFSMAISLSGVPSSSGIHPAGMLISPKPLNELVPLIRSKKEGIYATSLSLDDSESAGVLKFDFLSLASLNVYENTQRDIGYHVDLATVNFDDEKVWNLVGSKYTTGLFQISSKTYKSRMPRLKPKSIGELAACLALLRGPCISSGADKDYMEILEGKKEIDFIHPLYYQATQDTLGILLYQEQVMQIAVNFGFSLEEGYNLVKVVAKKKMDKIMAFKEMFMKKARLKDVAEDVAERIWHVIQDAGKYCFNRAHAVTYALLCFVSAYLKAYHPKEFLVNLLTNAYNRGKTEEVVEALEDCRRLGYRFLPADINHSDWGFSIEGDMIRMGLCSLKGFGLKAAEEVFSKRPYTSFEDFMERIEKNKCSKRSLIPGIFSNLFHEFGEPLDIYNQFCAIRKEDPLDQIKLQSKEVFAPTDELSVFENIFFGGQFLTDPANNLEPSGFRDKKKGSVIVFDGFIKNVKRTNDRNGNKIAFLTLATGDGYIEATLFSDCLKKYTKLLKKNTTCRFKVKKDGDFSSVVHEVA